MTSFTDAEVELDSGNDSDSEEYEFVVLTVHGGRFMLVNLEHEIQKNLALTPVQYNNTYGVHILF